MTALHIQLQISHAYCEREQVQQYRAIKQQWVRYDTTGASFGCQWKRMDNGIGAIRKI